MNIDESAQEPEKPFHSSGYAEVSNGGSIGSTNSQTFGQRYATDRNRVVVRKYRDSHIGRGALRHQVRSGTMDPFARIDPPEPFPGQSQGVATSSSANPLGHSAAAPPPRASFKEPPARGFNPYS